jgi:hypothetical protein
VQISFFADGFKDIVCCILYIEMFIFYEEFEGLSWFHMEGRSLYQIATGFQKNQMPSRFIRAVGGAPLVGITPEVDHDFIVGGRYHLFIRFDRKNTTRVFAGDAYVPDLYRMPVIPIDRETWNRLYRCGMSYACSTPSENSTVITFKPVRSLRPQRVATHPDIRTTIRSPPPCPDEAVEYQTDLDVERERVERVERVERMEGVEREERVESIVDFLPADSTDYTDYFANMPGF